MSPDLLTSSSSPPPPPAAEQSVQNQDTAPSVVVVVVDTTTTSDSTGVPYNQPGKSSSSPTRGGISAGGGRRERSSPLASMDSSSSSSPIATMQMGSFIPPPAPPAADPVGGDNSEHQYAESDDLQNELNNNNSYKNKSSGTHNSRRIWYYVGGAIFLVVIIAAIAGGAVTSNNNKEAAASASSTNGGGAADGSINIPLNPLGANATDANGAPKSELYLFIESLLPDGGLALHDAQSYQSMALQFVQDTHNADYSLERITQRFVLACIYHATHAVKTTYTDYALGENSPVFPWLNSDGWLEVENECEWFGITCNNNTTGGGLVEAIDLHENLLTGTFPPETALLKNSLLVLDIEENIIYNAGNDGINWLGELVNLQELNLAKTSFQYDGIPPVIGKLVNLIELDVSYSLFFGPLREEVFENLKKLQFLYIGGNSYNSSLPASIGRLDSLVYLYAEFSDINGDLSFLTTAAADGSSSSGLSSIYELWIDKNFELTGEIPSQIGHLTTLASLSLTECDLYGKIPTEMGNLINMKQLWLYGNRLTGDIPTNLGNMRELDRLELEDNNLQGEMPSQVCANVYPRGRLEVLEADCGGSGDSAKINCNATSCCTCCGPECAGNAPQTLRDSSSTAAGNSGGTRNPSNRKKQRRLDFFKGQQQDQQQQQQHSS